MTTPLRQLKVNQRAVIKAITTKGDLARRIRDMGLIAGKEIMVIGRAPLHDPVAIKTAESIITLRNSEADFITCEVPDE